MSRPRRNEDLAVRMTVYVSPKTKATLDQIGVIDKRPVGQIIDTVFEAVGVALLNAATDQAMERDMEKAWTADKAMEGWKDPDTEPQSEADTPSVGTLAGQPGVEHRTVGKAGKPRPAVRKSSVTVTASDAVGCVVGAIPEFIDHPGWKLNSLGANVCTRCGKQKRLVKNKSCVAP